MWVPSFENLSLTLWARPQYNFNCIWLHEISDKVHNRFIFPYEFKNINSRYRENRAILNARFMRPDYRGHISSPLLPLFVLADLEEATRLRTTPPIYYTYWAANTHSKYENQPIFNSPNSLTVIRTFWI